MQSKTHHTAVALIPPEAIWEPIQSIRRHHDRQLRRWMPHINLIYPFRPREQFDVLDRPLREVCRAVEPFTVKLREFRQFRHRGGRRTLWLAPEPREPLQALQAALEAIVPDCNEQSRHTDGFTPHLSVGQARGARSATLLAELQASWRPLGFPVSRISLIWRGDPPDDVFRVDRRIELGSPGE
jgi:2'-5' RNA ligase